MEAPCSDIKFTSSQFDVFVEIVKTVRIQMLNGQSGEIAFAGLIELNWSPNEVGVEIVANRT